jgi:hypothetical protein
MSTGGQSTGPGPHRGRLQPISDGAARVDPRFDGRGRARVAADFNHSTASAYPRPGDRGRVRVGAGFNRSATGSVGADLRSDHRGRGRVGAGFNRSATDGGR